MKNIKFIFALSAIAFVVLSAFRKPNLDTTVYGVDSSGNVHAILLSQENITWVCSSGNKYCTYSDPQLKHPNQSSQSYQFELIP